MKLATPLKSLSAAVVAGGLLFGAAGQALASPVQGTLPAVKSVAAVKQDTAAKAKNRAASRAAVAAVATAKTTDDLKAGLSTNVSDPALRQAALSLLASVPKNAPQTIRSQNRIDGVTGTTPSQLALIALKASVGDGAGTCDTNTTLNKWAGSLVTFPSDETEAGKNQRYVFSTLIAAGYFDAPTYQAVYEGDSKPLLKRMGEEQDKTSVVKKAFTRVKSFWDVKPGKITLSAMKDDIVTGRKPVSLRMLSRYATAGVTASAAAGFDPRDPFATGGYTKEHEDKVIKELPRLLDYVPALDGGENPLFTANAFAYAPTPGAKNEAGLPKRFVFGDGMLSYLRVAKTGDAGIQVVTGHEYGHHIQYTIGIDTPEKTVPEQTRHSELEADAFGNYFAAHTLGLDFNKAQRETAKALGYAIGDCDPTGDGHHGTPVQRQASTVWAQGLADTQKKSKHVFAAESVRVKYNKKLPNILAAK